MADAIPTTAFNNVQHVLRGRNRHDGREVFFDLESIVAAEAPFENGAQQQVPTQAPIDPVALASAIAAHIPPPELLTQHTHVLAELTNQVVAAHQRVAEFENRAAALEARVDLFEKTLLRIGESLPAQET